MRFVILIAILLTGLAQTAYASGSLSLSCRQILGDSPSWKAHSPNFSFEYNEPSEVADARRSFVTNGNYDLSTTGIRSLNGVKFLEDSFFRTVRVLPLNGPAKEPQLLAMAFHGNGTERSRATTMADLLRMFTLADSTRTTRYLQNELGESLTSISIEAVDAPGCGFGPALKEFSNLNRTIEWIAGLIIQKRKEAPNLPFMAFTRSSSAGLLMAVAKKYPGLIDILVMMSPTLPGHPEILDAGTRLMNELESQGTFTINRPGLNWIDKMLKALPPWSPDYFAEMMPGDFGDMKVFILTGERDHQVVQFEKQLYAEIATGNPNVVFRNYNADHEVTSTSDSNRAVGRQAYIDIFTFINNALKGNPIK